MNALEREACLVCEALVREMRDATRWQTIKEAWEALLAVRRMSKQMLEEHPPCLPECMPPEAHQTGCANAPPIGSSR